MSINNCTLMGRITADLEPRQTANGISVVLKKLKADAKKELADLHKKETQRLAEEMNRKVAKAEALKRKAEAEDQEIKRGGA